ncbi:MAG TPA: amino acid ABC transporter permease [Rhodopila sp.]|jgi:polar amino acid transport system permease protein|nr:amino acid ABC transporter permease [Rhodopila sp.]
MLGDLDFSPLLESWRYLAAGLGVTLALSALTVVSSLLLGSAIGFARVYGPVWISRILTFYIDSMRAIPVLVVLVWMYFAFPLVAGISLPPFWAAWAALTMHVAAYVAEILRAGINSIRPGQTRAAQALGMSGAQVVSKVVFPQAVIRMLPALGSIVSVTIKDTAIAATIAVPEYMERSQTLAGQSFRPVEVFTTAMIVYFIILFPATRAVDMLYRRVAHLGRS